MPHVIPQEVHQMNHVVTICPNTPTSKFGAAVCHIVVQEYRLNAVIDETTGVAMGYKHLIK
eukprot:13050818-Ditylum_brightwellii.AAC.2